MITVFKENIQFLKEISNCPLFNHILQSSAGYDQKNAPGVGAKSVHRPQENFKRKNQVQAGPLRQFSNFLRVNNFNLQLMTQHSRNLETGQTHMTNSTSGPRKFSADTDPDDEFYADGLDYNPDSNSNSSKVRFKL
jgi:hypothetical protein